MKILAFLLLSSLTVALVLAFPGGDNTVDHLPAAGLPAAPSSSAGGGAAAATSSADELRQPRHILKHLLGLDRPVIVQPQPIFVNQPPPYSNGYYYSGAGRGYNYNGYGSPYW